MTPEDGFILALVCFIVALAWAVGNAVFVWFTTR